VEAAVALNDLFACGVVHLGGKQPTRRRS
jgi:hypothetical protein